MLIFILKEWPKKVFLRHKFIVYPDPFAIRLQATLPQNSSDLLEHDGALSITNNAPLNTVDSFLGIYIFIAGTNC